MSNLVKSSLIPMFLIFILSCNGKDKELMLRIGTAESEMKEVAGNINEDFTDLRSQVGFLASFIEGLYEEESIRETLKSVDTSLYALHPDGVFYKPQDDGKSAVFVSGYYPVTEEIKRHVYFTEPADQVFMEICRSFPAVAQAYYNDKYSYNRIYPFFDVITQYEPKINIPSFNFYFLADEEHNPDRDALWVNEPYIDPAGRGWMVSAIAPVYVHDSLEGVAGLDVTINTITDRYIGSELNDIAILDSSGTVVSIQDYLVTLFSLPGLQNHKYLETIKQDSYLADDYNLLLSKSKEIRRVATDIFKNRQNRVTFSKGDEEYIVLVEDILELDWKIFKVLKK